jgi:hypothetical protein
MSLIYLYKYSFGWIMGGSRVGRAVEGTVDADKFVYSNTTGLTSITISNPLTLSLHSPSHTTLSAADP